MGWDGVLFGFVWRLVCGGRDRGRNGVMNWMGVYLGSNVYL